MRRYRPCHRLSTFSTVLPSTGMNARPKICSDCISKAIRGSANSSCTRIGPRASIQCVADFDAGKRFEPRAMEPKWEPPTIVTAPGAFAMPIGPVFSDFAESAHFLLESVGEDVIRTIPRFFYKYRGVEKIAEGQPADRALLLAERFSGIAAFAHGLAFCEAVEAICGVDAAAAGAGAPHRVCRTGTAAQSRGGHHRHLQLDRAGGGDQPSRAHRGKPAALELRNHRSPLFVRLGCSRRRRL